MRDGKHRRRVAFIAVTWIEPPVRHNEPIDVEFVDAEGWFRPDHVATMLKPDVMRAVGTNLGVFETLEVLMITDQGEVP